MRRDGDGEAADEFLNQNAVANGIRAGAITDADGRFELKPLPPGNYRAEIASRVDNPMIEQDRRQPELTVNDVFVPMTITIDNDLAIEQPPLEIRAVPHVLVRGRSLTVPGNREPVTHRIYGDATKFPQRRLSPRCSPRWGSTPART